MHCEPTESTLNVLVAGATGNTGIRFVKALASRGHRPIALVRESSDTSALPANTELRQGDLTRLRDDVCNGCDAVDDERWAGTALRMQSVQ